MEHLLVAIDQGETKTDVIVLKCSGEICAYVTDKDFRNSMANFDNNRYLFIYHSIQQAILEIHSSLDNVVYILAAMCGADWQEDFVNMQNTLAKTLLFPKEKIIIVNDCIAALRAGIPFRRDNDNYAVICAGTRLNCSLWSKDDMKYTYGRFINIEDHGAYAIGQHIWSGIIDSYNGFQSSTILEAKLLQFYNKKSLADLYACFTCNNIVFNPSKFAHLLVEAIKCNDKVSINIMNTIAHRWVQYIVRGLSKVALTHESKFTVILTGGVLQNYESPFIERIKYELKNYCPNATCVVASLKPVVGAAILVLEEYHKDKLDINIEKRFTDSLIYKRIL